MNFLPYIFFSWSTLHSHGVIGMFVNADKWMAHSYTFCACPLMLIGSEFFQILQFIPFAASNSFACLGSHFHRHFLRICVLESGSVEKKGPSLKTSFPPLQSLHKKKDAIVFICFFILTHHISKLQVRNNSLCSFFITNFGSAAQLFLFVFKVT